MVTSYILSDTTIAGVTYTGCTIADLSDPCRTILVSINEIKNYVVRFKIASMGTFPTVISVNRMETQDIVFEVTCQDLIVSPYSVTEILINEEESNSTG